MSLSRRAQADRRASTIRPQSLGARRGEDYQIWWRPDNAGGGESAAQAAGAMRCSLAASKRWIASVSSAIASSAPVAGAR